MRFVKAVIIRKTGITVSSQRVQAPTLGMSKSNSADNVQRNAVGGGWGDLEPGCWKKRIWLQYHHHNRVMMAFKYTYNRPFGKKSKWQVDQTLTHI